MICTPPPTPTLEDFHSQLRRHKLKATRQRIAVHEVMMDLGHASVDMVREQLESRGSKVTAASVYNILSQLADLRIYSRRLSSTNKMFFDINTFRHIHLYDRENHTFRDVLDEELHSLITSHMKRRKFRGYTVEDIDIQLIARPTTRKSRNV